jgi:hypothetical protein
MQTIRKGDKIMKYIKMTSFAMASMFFFVLLGLLPKPAHATLACCQINANGTPRSAGSFRCNLSSAETRKFGVGLYEVDFTPVSTDIRNYPRSAVLDNQVNFPILIPPPVAGQIGLADRAGDFSSIVVRTTNSFGVNVDAGFDICIH